MIQVPVRLRHDGDRQPVPDHHGPVRDRWRKAVSRCAARCSGPPGRPPVRAARERPRQTLPAAASPAGRGAHLQVRDLASAWQQTGKLSPAPGSGSGHAARHSRTSAPSLRRERGRALRDPDLDLLAGFLLFRSHDNLRCSWIPGSGHTMPAAQPRAALAARIFRTWASHCTISNHPAPPCRVTRAFPSAAPRRSWPPW